MFYFPYTISYNIWFLAQYERVMCDSIYLIPQKMNHD